MKRWIGVVIVALVLLGAGGYYLYWNALADGLKSGFANWVERERASGAEVAHGDVTVSGFPYRLEFHVADPAYALPQRKDRPGWSADGLTLYLQTWKRGHAIVRFEGEQRFTRFMDGTQMNANLTPEEALASVRFDDAGRLIRFDSDWKNMGVTGTVPVRRIERLRLNGRSSGAPKPVQRFASEDFEFAMRFENVALTPGQPLGDMVELYRLSLLFDPMPASNKPADLEAWRTSGGMMEMTALEIVSGDMSISGKGTFALDAQARPEGSLNLYIRGTDRFATVLSESRNFPTAAQFGLRLALKALEKTDDQGKPFVPLPITIQNGEIKLLGLSSGQVTPLYRKP